MRLFEGVLPPLDPECERDGAFTEGRAGLEGARVVIAGCDVRPVRGVTVPTRGREVGVLATDGRDGYEVGVRVAVTGRLDGPVEGAAVTGARRGARVGVTERLTGRRAEAMAPVAVAVRAAVATCSLLAERLLATTDRSTGRGASDTRRESSSLPFFRGGRFESSEDFPSLPLRSERDGFFASLRCGVAFFSSLDPVAGAA